MQHKRFPPDDAREWLNRARSNLARAATVVPGAYWEDLCFDAQQPAEKAIKAVLVHNGIEFPYVHYLSRLLSILEVAGVRIPKHIRQAERLTRFAVESRYPGFSGPVTKREYESVVRRATAVIN